MKLEKPDGRDVHAYGGLVLMSAGIEVQMWGLVVLGAALAYLGIWRMA